MSEPFELIGEIDVGNILGEGIQWRANDHSVWWTDIMGCKLFRYDWATKAVRHYEMPEPLGSFAFMDDSAVIMAAFASGFALYHFENETIQWLRRPTFLAGEERFNDGRVDRQGRFWSGTMMAMPRSQEPATGRLFCLDTMQKLSVHESGVNISNGLCWSPNGRRLYFADSLLGIIFQYTFDTQTGSLSDKRIFAHSPKGGAPDGAAVDAEGNVWSAQWGIGKVLAYNPMGEVIADIPVPTNQPSCVAFGGENYDHLLVTSAKDGLSAQALAEDRSAGNVFIYKLQTTGLPESTYMNGLL